jgi:hypothetical protein
MGIQEKTAPIPPAMRPDPSHKSQSGHLTVGCGGGGGCCCCFFSSTALADPSAADVMSDDDWYKWKD